MRNVEDAAGGLVAHKALAALCILLERALLTEVVLAARDHRVLALLPGLPADEAGKGQVIVVLLCGKGRACGSRGEAG